jgi:hypothetical protein
MARGDTSELYNTLLIRDGFINAKVTLHTIQSADFAGRMIMSQRKGHILNGSTGYGIHLEECKLRRLCFSHISRPHEKLALIKALSDSGRFSFSVNAASDGEEIDI